jgi:hypothetical protein
MDETIGVLRVGGFEVALNSVSKLLKWHKNLNDSRAVSASHVISLFCFAWPLQSECKLKAVKLFVMVTSVTCKYPLLYLQDFCKCNQSTTLKAAQLPNELQIG